jgi:hypothetical protein
MAIVRFLFEISACKVKLKFLKFKTAGTVPYTLPVVARTRKYQLAPDIITPDACR